MRIKRVLRFEEVIDFKGDETTEFTGLAYDSRKVTPGDLFFCVRGYKTDGHLFAGQAVQAGAVAVVCEEEVKAKNRVLVEDSRRVMAKTASLFYNNPSSLLILTGITGTNGKTTTSYILENIFNANGLRAGLIGTIEDKIDGRSLAVENTTPESVELQELLYRMACEGVQGVVMEVSSHAIALHRTEGTFFRGLIFTNLSHDHLDFHETRENYFNTKKELFLKNTAAVKVINIDDEAGAKIFQDSASPKSSYSIVADSDYRADNIEMTGSGSAFEIFYKNRSCRIRTRLVGKHNIYNTLAAFALAVELGFSETSVTAGIEATEDVRGRFQFVREGQAFEVVVDYAHTPDGLENVLKAAREIAAGKLITVFGCGGDRDRRKRPVMAGVAAALSDTVIITSDNPRSEDPEGIISEIEAGIPAGREYQKVTDRREAIKQALAAAGAGDMVVIAGKGHEDYQIFKDRTIDFSDVETTREILREMMKG